jgi:hypothetical protein
MLERRKGPAAAVRAVAQTAREADPDCPGGYSPGHTHPKSAFIYATVLEGAIRDQVNDGPVTTYEAGKIRGGHERDGTDDPIRELRS